MILKKNNDDDFSDIDSDYKSDDMETIIKKHTEKPMSKQSLKSYEIQEIERVKKQFKALNKAREDAKLQKENPQQIKTEPEPAKVVEPIKEKNKKKIVEEKLPTAEPVVTESVIAESIIAEPKKQAKPKKEPKPKKELKPKKEPKIIYESSSEEEVVIVKKKKKQPKIIYQDASSDDEIPPPQQKKKPTIITEKKPQIIKTELIRFF